MQGVPATRAALRVVDDMSPDETSTPTPTSRATATMPEMILLDKNWFMRTPLKLACLHHRARRAEILVRVIGHGMERGRARRTLVLAWIASADLYMEYFGWIHFVAFTA